MSGIINAVGSKSGVIGKTIALNPYTTLSDNGHGLTRTFTGLPSWATTFHIVFYPATGAGFSGGSPDSVNCEGEGHIRIRFNGQGGSSNNHIGFNSNANGSTDQEQGIQVHTGDTGRHLYGSIDITKFTSTQYFFSTSGLLVPQNTICSGGGLFYLADHLNQIQLDWTTGHDFDDHGSGGGYNYVAYK